MGYIWVIFLISFPMRDSLNIRMKGAWPFGSIYPFIPISDSILYCASGNTFYIFNVTDPTNIIKIDSFESPWLGYLGVYSIFDTLLLTTQFKGGITLYNIANEKEPIIISNYLTPDIPRGCHFIPPLAYVACFEAGLRIYDYSNPYLPREIGALNLPYIAEDVKVKDTFAYVANHLGGFKVINVADPYNPRMVFSHEIPGQTASSILVIDTIAIIAWDYAGLRIWNISNPTQPFEISNVYGPAGFIDRINDTLIIVQRSATEQHIFNIKNPNSPIRVGILQNVASPAIWKNRCYVALSRPTIHRDTLIVLNIENPSSPIVLGTYGEFHGLTEKIFVSGNYVFTGTRENGIKIYDVSVPSKPKLISQYGVNIKLIGGILVKDTIAYFTSESTLYVISIKDPENPRLITTLTSLSGSLYLKDTLLFVCGDSLWIVNVRKPSLPRRITAIRSQGTRFTNCAVYDKLLVTTEGYFGMRIFDISDPANPVFLSKCDTTAHVNGVVIKYPYAYLCGGYGLLVFDISDPRNPIWLTYYLTPDYAWDVEIDSNIAYLATAWYGVRAIDISNPNSPREIGYYITPVWAKDLYIKDGLIYVADEEGWLILEYYGSAIKEKPNIKKLKYLFYQPKTKTLLIKAEPNTIVESLTIFDVLGRVVYSYHNNKKNDLIIKPMELNPGCYFVKLSLRQKEKPFTFITKLNIVK